MGIPKHIVAAKIISKSMGFFSRQWVLAKMNDRETETYNGLSILSFTISGFRSLLIILLATPKFFLFVLFLIINKLTPLPY